MTGEGGRSLSRQMVLDSYDIPDQVFGKHSQAFVQFIRTWFGDSRALSRGEIDLTFLNDLTPDEVQLAREVLRRNLGLRYTHIIEGLAILHDVDAAPMLRELYASEPDSSRRLSIAGSLWRLTRDPVFVDCLNHMKTSRDRTLKPAHFHQVFWLEDERTLDFLFDFLEFIRFLALSNLVALEFQRPFHVPARDLPRSPVDYLRRRNDRAFRSLMVEHLKARNGAVKNGK